MSDAWSSKLSGPAAMLGGGLWIGGAIATALRPEGCVGAECSLPGRSMRETSALEGGLFVAAVLLIAIGLAGLVVRARAMGRFGRLGRSGAITSAVGLAAIVISGLVQGLFFGGDFPLMPFFVIPAGLTVVIGLLLSGIAILRAQVLPRWAGVLLIIGALALLGTNDQDARVLMSVPFGIAWLGVGYVLWSGRHPG